MLPPRPKARSVQQCELYLDRLAAVMRKAGGAEARRLVTRFKAELEAARSEDALLLELLNRPSSDGYPESEAAND